MMGFSPGLELKKEDRGEAITSGSGLTKPLRSQPGMHQRVHGVEALPRQPHGALLAQEGSALEPQRQRRAAVRQQVEPAGERMGVRHRLIEGQREFGCFGVGSVRTGGKKESAKEEPKRRRNTEPETGNTDVPRLTSGAQSERTERTRVGSAVFRTSAGLEFDVRVSRREVDRGVKIKAAAKIPAGGGERKDMSAPRGAALLLVFSCHTPQIERVFPRQDVGAVPPHEHLDAVVEGADAGLEGGALLDDQQGVPGPPAQGAVLTGTLDAAVWVHAVR
ncbi:hypothetical protein EYF80_054656 [Liparis tanakae]|uniref:Uncharacterized protein n=1 Tax=Liparis tanakae TaxID=230148 RepID=A0A4Z2F2N9_9TELE|nr:hypothetical protein EYF80_054656 [Liparis tanakae]